MVPNKHNSSGGGSHTLHCMPRYKFLPILPKRPNSFSFSDSVVFTLLTLAGIRRNFHRRWRTSAMVRFFGALSILILAAVAASMVVLPLMLPPLPPPPLVLLFFPVGIMAALMLLAFAPSDVPVAANVVV
ncbi:hypothetical protein CR513_58094, partial [Mucuna pruriens]